MAAIGAGSVSVSAAPVEARRQTRASAPPETAAKAPAKKPAAKKAAPEKE
jgi:hypothetical protein